MIKINLLPLEERPKIQVQVTNLLILFIGIVIPLLLMVGVVLAFMNIQSLKQTYNATTEKRKEYGSKYDEVIGTEKALSEVENKLRGKDQLVASYLNPSGILRPMQEIIPVNVSFSSISISPEHTVSLSGTSADFYGPAALLLRLRKDPRYDKVTMGNVISNKDGGVGFSMSFTLRGVANTP